MQPKAREVNGDGEMQREGSTYSQPKAKEVNGDGEVQHEAETNVGAGAEVKKGFPGGVARVEEQREFRRGQREHSPEQPEHLQGQRELVRVLSAEHDSDARGAAAPTEPASDGLVTEVGDKGSGTQPARRSASEALSQRGTQPARHSAREGAGASAGSASARSHREQQGQRGAPLPGPAQVHAEAGEVQRGEDLPRAARTVRGPLPGPAQVHAEPGEVRRSEDSPRAARTARGSLAGASAGP